MTDAQMRAIETLLEAGLTVCMKVHRPRLADTLVEVTKVVAIPRYRHVPPHLVVEDGHIVNAGTLDFTDIVVPGLALLSTTLPMFKDHL